MATEHATGALLEPEVVTKVVVVSVMEAVAAATTEREYEAHPDRFIHHHPRLGVSGRHRHCLQPRRQ